MWAGGNPAAVRLLVERGADVRTTTKTCDVKYTIYIPTTFTLGKTGIPWNNDGAHVSKQGGQNALFFAVQKRDLESVRILMDAGLDVNETAADGTTPLLASLYKWVPLDGTFVRGQGAPATSGSSQRFGPDLATARFLLGRGASGDKIRHHQLYAATRGCPRGRVGNSKRGQGRHRRILLSSCASVAQPCGHRCKSMCDDCGCGRPEGTHDGELQREAKKNYWPHDQPGQSVGEKEEKRQGTLGSKLTEAGWSTRFRFN